MQLFDQSFWKNDPFLGIWFSEARRKDVFENESTARKRFKERGFY